MFGLVIAIAIAFSIYFANGVTDSANSSSLGYVIIAVTTFSLLAIPLTLALSWTPLQKAEQKLTPRILMLFRKDWRNRFSIFWLEFFPLISYLIALDLILSKIIPSSLLLAIWIVLLGITLDAIHIFLKRTFGYLDPFFVIDLFSRKSYQCIQNDKEIELCEWMDGFTEIAIKGIEANSLSLPSAAINELQQVTSSFLVSSKSLTHHAQDAQSQALGISDKVSYTLFFALQRLEMINEKAGERKLEPLCSQLIASFGKITLAAAKYDISMPSYPLHFLGRSTLFDQRHAVTEVGSKAICTLIEVAKSMLEAIDVKYAELQDPYLTLISQMQLISKQLFRQDKAINIKLLIQPFHDLKSLFMTEKMANHPDTAVIIQAIDRVLAEFEALEAVMRTIPPIPEDLLKE